MEKCIFCLENDISTVFVGCGHMSCCIDCATNIQIKVCPNCRKAGDCIKIYKSGFEMDKLEFIIKENENEIELAIKEKENELKRLQDAKNILTKTIEEKKLLNDEMMKTYNEINRLKNLTLEENLKIKQDAERIKNDFENSKISLENSIRKIYNEADQSSQNEKNLNKTIELLCKSKQRYRIQNLDDVPACKKIRYLVKKKNGNLQLSKTLDVIDNNQNGIVVKKGHNVINLNKNTPVFILVQSH